MEAGKSRLRLEHCEVRSSAYDPRPPFVNLKTIHTRPLVGPNGSGGRGYPATVGRPAGAWVRTLERDERPV